MENNRLRQKLELDQLPQVLEKNQLHQRQDQQHQVQNKILLNQKSQVQLVQKIIVHANLKMNVKKFPHVIGDMINVQLKKEK